MANLPRLDHVCTFSTLQVHIVYIVPNGSFLSNLWKAFSCLGIGGSDLCYLGLERVFKIALIATYSYLKANPMGNIP